MVLSDDKSLQQGAVPTHATSSKQLPAVEGRDMKPARPVTAASSSPTAYLVAVICTVRIREAAR
jgi:hypothetical protein